VGRRDPGDESALSLDHRRRSMPVVTLDKADLFACVLGFQDKVTMSRCQWSRLPMSSKFWIEQRADIDVGGFRCEARPADSPFPPDRALKNQVVRRRPTGLPYYRPSCVRFPGRTIASMDSTAARQRRRKRLRLEIGHFVGTGSGPSASEAQRPAGSIIRFRDMADFIHRIEK